MSLKDKASLIFKPSRYKSGKAYSFRGEDFTFTRSSVANRINSAGNLEEVASGVPRLNYNRTDLTKCPTLLLEPVKTNTVPYYKYQSSGFNLGANITWNGFVKSPDGTNNASRFTSSLASASYVQATNVTIPAGDFTFSMWVRGIEGSFVNRSMYIPSHTGQQATMNEAPSIGEDWKFVYGSGTNTSGSSYSRSVTLPFYDQPPGAVWEMYGFQLESGSYPTSLIKTSGSSATRDTDKVDGQVNASFYNDSEGVLYVDFSALSATRDNEFRFLISDGTNNERIQIGLQTGGDIYGSVITGNSATASFNYTLPNPTKTHKIAIKYKANDCALWVDGVKRGVDINATMPSGLNVFDFYRTPNNNNYVEANLQEVLYFPVGLSDAELLSLTSYDDYADLVERNDLTWESPTITNNRLTALKEL